MEKRERVLAAATTARPRWATGEAPTKVVAGVRRRAIRSLTCDERDIERERVLRFFGVDVAHRARLQQEQLSREQRVRESAAAQMAARAVDREARERAFAVAVRSRAQERRAKRARVEAIAAADMGGRGAAKVARTL
jgi:hypothetical protein